MTFIEAIWDPLIFKIVKYFFIWLWVSIPVAMIVGRIIKRGGGENGKGKKTL